MVSNNRYKPPFQRLTSARRRLIVTLSGLILITLVVPIWQTLFIDDDRMIPLPSSGMNHIIEAKLRSERANYKKGKASRPVITSAIFDESDWNEWNKNIAVGAATKEKVQQNSCRNTGIVGLKELKPEELFPVAGKRHMITPPKDDGRLSLVCCDTTKGPLEIVVHPHWAPLGAELFLKMVTSGYFDSGVPMMRCLKGFLCQFGINSDRDVTKNFHIGKIKDDPNWLPEGPKYRQNSEGVKRFAIGYLAYAGSGKESRGNQLIVALDNNGPLAGGSPWEVPWGELVGETSFETLSKIYTGYGEDGPQQGNLHKYGMNETMKEQFPKIDYINKCVVVDETGIESSVVLNK